MEDRMEKVEERLFVCVYEWDREIEEKSKRKEGGGVYEKVVELGRETKIER
jgi:hypothetical protein